MSDPLMMVVVFVIFLVSGVVKGVVGLGLQTIALGLLTAVAGLHEAMALLLAPAFLSNVWQVFPGGDLKVLFKRIWPFLLAGALTVWIGAAALTRVDVSWLTALLGLVLFFYAIAGLVRPHFIIPRQHERWLGPVLGGFNGILTGMTGSFVVPGVMYLQSIGLARDELIQAMGMLFLLMTVALAVALGGNNLLTVDLGFMSALAVVPSLIGVAIGRKVRQRISERVFRRVFFISLLALGAYIIVRSLV